MNTAAGAATRTYDRYGYEAAGNRITHYAALNGLEKTNYDSLGRVIQTISERRVCKMV